MSFGDPIPIPTYIYNKEEPSNSVISLNMSGITKLTPTNYITWKLQVYALFEAHELHHFLITETDETPDRSNPKHALWRRQDKMLYSSLISTLSPPVQAFIARTTTTRDVWLTLARTYGQPSRRHIKQQLRRTLKGTQSITEYMGSVMTKADQLALLGAPVDHEDLLNVIVDGLGEEYGAVTEMVDGRDVPMTIEELHGKLLNRENALKGQKASPAAANVPLLDNNQTAVLFIGVTMVLLIVHLIVDHKQPSTSPTRR